ncbi:MAG: glycosyltransferase family 4 protein, partial [Deltaproteobacteria bacterium]|nr:glycosyltransferase family 4 protein [Deltaproteobacteria bacterium]
TEVMMSGNLGGLAYNYAKYLRRKKVDVHLFLWDWEMDAETRNPLLHDISSFPDWIHSFSKSNISFREYRKVAKDFDIVHSLNTDPIFAQFCGRPFISHPCGSDARVFAFENGIYPLLYRRAFKKNHAFFFSQLDYYKNVFPKLTIKRPEFIPHILPDDIEVNTADGIPERDGVEELFFHPSSHIHGTQGNVKGNDILIKAFAKYVKDFTPSAKMIMIDWGQDAESSKRLVKELDISEHVILKKKLSKNEYYTYIHFSDVVFDQFVVPSSSVIQMEACSLGKPVVKFMDDEWFRLYDKMPFVSAGSVNEIYQVLVDYHKDPDKYLALGSFAREFVKRNHSWEVVTGKIIKVYEQMLHGRSVN